MITERNKGDSLDEDKEDKNEKVVALKKAIIKDLLKKDPITVAHNIKSLYEVYGVVYFKSIMITLKLTIKSMIEKIEESNKSIIITNKRKRVLFSTIRQMSLVERIASHEKLYQLFCSELEKQPKPQRRKIK